MPGIKNSLRSEFYKPGTRSHEPASIALCVFLALAFLYWRGHCPTFGPGDSPQHVLSAITWGVSVSPGYPLYVILGHLASKLPWGAPAGNVNALSGLFHALAAAVFFLLLRRQGLKSIPALVATGLMALSPLFWYYSEIAEVRALNDFLALGAAYCAVAWTQEKKPPALLGLALFLGLGIGHHPTYVLILPAIACWLWASRGLPSPRQWLWFVPAAAFACALPYLILGIRIHLRAPSYNPNDTLTWLQVWELFTRKNVGGPLRMVVGTGVLGFGKFEPQRFFQHAGWLAGSGFTELTPAGIFLAAAGALRLGSRDLKSLAFWGLWLILSSLCFVAISSQQLALCDESYLRALVMRFYLLPFIGLFALAGFGAQWLWERTRPAFGWLLLSAVTLIPLALRPVNLRDHNQLMEYARAIVRSAGPGDMVVLAADDSIFAMTYLQLVERTTGGRVLLAPSMFSYPPTIRRLKALYPTLRIPPLAAQGLTTDWTQWLKLNAGRRLYAEPVLRDALLASYPDSAPSGVLGELRLTPLKRTRIAAEAGRFLDWAPLEEVSRWDLYTFTQEVYLLGAYRNILEWYGSFLGPKDEAAASRIKGLLKRL